MDSLAKERKQCRSEFIEIAIRDFLEQRVRAEQDAKDLAILDRKAESLNREAAEVWDYQIPL